MGIPQANGVEGWNSSLKIHGKIAAGVGANVLTDSGDGLDTSNSFKGLIARISAFGASVFQSFYFLYTKLLNICI